MAANVNSLLDRAENPEKMIDQYMRNLQSDLGQVKAETAAVMAEETRAKRELQECERDMEKYVDYAKKALEQGNEEDAKTFLGKKASLQGRMDMLVQQVKVASDNAIKMRELHEKLNRDMAELERRRLDVKTKMKLADTMNRANATSGGGVGGVQSNMEAFERMEEKANRMLDEADAMAELNKSERNELVDLEAKYEEQAMQKPIEDELEQLKKEMGL